MPTILEAARLLSSLATQVEAETITPVQALQQYNDLLGGIITSLPDDGFAALEGRVLTQEEEEGDGRMEIATGAQHDNFAVGDRMFLAPVDADGGDPDPVELSPYSVVGRAVHLTAQLTQYWLIPGAVPDMPEEDPPAEPPET